MDIELEEILTPDIRSWIGRSTESLPYPDCLTASDVRRYVDTTGDANPLWLDVAFAQASGYRGRLVPPSMVTRLVQRPTAPGGTEGTELWEKIPLPPKYTDTRNAETKIEWLQPVYVGEQLTIRHRIDNIVPRRGRSGIGLYITTETTLENQQGQLVVLLKQTIVRLPSTASGIPTSGGG